MPRVMYRAVHACIRRQHRRVRIRTAGTGRYCLGCILGMRPLLDLGRTQGQRVACVGHPVANGNCGRGMAPARHGPAWHWHGTGTGTGLDWHWPRMALAWNGTGPAWHGTGIGPAWHWPGMALARHGMQSAARASVLSSSESLQSITAHSLNGSSHSSLAVKAQLWSHRYSTAEYQASTHQ